MKMEPRYLGCYRGSRGQPLAQGGKVFAEVRDLRRAFAEVLVFVVLAERAVVGGLPEIHHEAFLHRALAEVAPARLPAFVGLLPVEVLEIDRDVVRLHEPRLIGPREAAFERGVADVETDADVFWIEVL